MPAIPTAARVALRAGSRVLGIIACGSTFRDEFSYPKLFSDYCDDFSSGLENFTVPDHFTNWWLEMVSPASGNSRFDARL